MLAYEVGIDPRNVMVAAFIGASDPADDVTYGSLVTTGKRWVQTTSDDPPYGVIVGTFIRDSDGTWQPEGTGGGGSGGGSGTSSEVVSGATVAFTDDLEVTVGAATYLINGVPYTSPQTVLPVTAADPTDDRIDVIALQDDGTAVIVEGTPGTPAVKPQIDPDTQVEVTFYTLPAAASTPEGVTSIPIYTDNLGSGGGEYDADQTGGHIDVNSTSSPIAGTKSVLGTAVVAGDVLFFDAAAPEDADPITAVIFTIKPSAAWTNKQTMRLNIQTGSTVKGINVVVSHNTFGFNRTSTDAQQIVVPMTAFSLPAGTTFDRFRIAFVGAGSRGFRIDTVFFQSSTPSTPTGGNLPPGGAAGTALFKQSGNNYDAIFRLIQQADIQGLTAALALLAPLASPALTGVPTVPTAAGGTNTTQAASTAFVKAAIDALIGDAPAALDTLGELSDALADDEDFAATVIGLIEAIDARVDDLEAGGTGAPDDADYLVKTAHASLSAERVVTDTTSITWDWATGGQAKAKRAALTGDVTASADSNSTTIANDAVTTAKVLNSAITNAKLANMADGTFKGNISGGSAAPSDLTKAEMRAALVVQPASQTADYTLVLADANTWVRMNKATAVNLTVPPNSSVAFPVGTEVHVSQTGVGQVTIVAGSGVTIRTPETLKLKKQYAVAVLKQLAADEWILAGYLEAA